MINYNLKKEVSNKVINRFNEEYNGYNINFNNFIIRRDNKPYNHIIIIKLDGKKDTSIIGTTYYYNTLNNKFTDEVIK